MKKKVIVIGLDGLEPTIVEAMLERGELPHFARIREAGFYSRLKTTTPAQTPVAWSSFATGTNPGGRIRCVSSSTTSVSRAFRPAVPEARN